MEQGFPGKNFRGSMRKKGPGRCEASDRQEKGNRNAKGKGEQNTA